MKVNKKDLQRAVLDIGNGFSKGKNGLKESEEHDFRSAYVVIDDNYIPESSELADFYKSYVRVNDTPLLVGDYAMKKFTGNYTAITGVERYEYKHGAYYKNMVGALLGFLYQDNANIDLALSQPEQIRKLKGDTLVNMFTEQVFLIERYDEKGKEVSFKIKIKNVSVKSEGFGVRAYKVFDSTAQNLLSEGLNILKSVTVVADIGHLTTDFLAWDGGQLIEGSYQSFNMGINNVLLKLRQLVSERFPVLLSMREALEVLETGVLFYNGEQHSVTDQVNKAMQEFTEGFNQTWDHAIKHIATRAKYVLLGGGGSVGVKTYLEIPHAGLQLASKNQPHKTHMRGLYRALEAQKNREAKTR